MSPRAARPAADPVPVPVEPEAPRWFERPAPGRMRAAVDGALAEAGLGGAALISAEMARDLADLVDSARERQDPKLWLASAARLDTLLSRLLNGAAGVDSGPVGPDPISDALGSDPE